MDGVERYRGLRVGVLWWADHDEIGLSHEQGLQRLGCEVVCFRFDQRLPPSLDVVIAHGPFGSIMPFARQLQATADGGRPALAFFQTEQFPNPRIPEWFRFHVGAFCSRLERAAYRRNDDGLWRCHPLYQRLAKGMRYRYYGDLYWLRDQGLIEFVATWSHVTAPMLEARGFETIILSRAYTPVFGDLMNLERDVDVLWFGKPGSARRRRLLRKLRRELSARGVTLTIIDGIEHPYVFGRERTLLLNRTKIVLNLLRQTWDENSLRYSLAAHNGALVVSEPTLPHTPSYRHGEHLVEVPVERLAETICYYLEHEEERKQMAMAAHRLATGDRFVGRSVKEMLDRALQLKWNSG